MPDTGFDGVVTIPHKSTSGASPRGAVVRRALRYFSGPSWADGKRSVSPQTDARTVTMRINVFRHRIVGLDAVRGLDISDGVEPARWRYVTMSYLGVQASLNRAAGQRLSHCFIEKLVLSMKC